MWYEIKFALLCAVKTFQATALKEWTVVTFRVTTYERLCLWSKKVQEMTNSFDLGYANF